MVKGGDSAARDTGSRDEGSSDPDTGRGESDAGGLRWCTLCPMADGTTRDLTGLLESIGGRDGRLVHLQRTPARPGRHDDWPDWADPDLVAAYRRIGVERPWTHQVAAGVRLASACVRIRVPLKAAVVRILRRPPWIIAVVP